MFEPKSALALLYLMDPDLETQHACTTSELAYKPGGALSITVYAPIRKKKKRLILKIQYCYLTFQFLSKTHTKNFFQINFKHKHDLTGLQACKTLQGLNSLSLVVFFHVQDYS